jgi:hypothetical protein
MESIAPAMLSIFVASAPLRLALPLTEHAAIGMMRPFDVVEEANR